MDEVILRVSPKELSEFPCPLEGERNCDNNCDNSKKVTKNNQKGITKVGININKGKDQLTSKVKKVRRRGKKGSRRGNTEESRENSSSAPHSTPGDTLHHKTLTARLEELSEGLTGQGTFLAPSNPC